MFPAKSPVVCQLYRRREEDDDSSVSCGHDNPAFVSVPLDEGDAAAGANASNINLGTRGNVTVSAPPSASKDISLLKNDPPDRQDTHKLPNGKPQGSVEQKEVISSCGEAKPAVTQQVLAAFLAALTHVALGAIVGLPGVTLPQLTDPRSSDLHLGINQVALFGSLIHVGGVIGSMVGGVLNMRVGQRVTLLVAMPLSLVLWLALAFTPSVWLLLFLRALLGATQGLVGAASNNYVVEIAQKEIRGRLTGFTDTGRQVGFLLVYVVGSLDLTWREVMLVCGCITAVPPFIGLLFMPDSPRWLVTKGRLEEARKALAFFRGPRYDSQPEYDDIIQQFEHTTNNKTGFSDQMNQMREPSVFRRMVFLAFLMVAVQFTGNMSIATYVVPIFQASNSTFNSYTSAILIGCIRVVGTVVSQLLADRLSRRIMVIIPCLACSVTLAVLGAYFFVQSQQMDVSSIGWLPLTALMVYTPFVCIVQAAISILRAEILPTSIRAFSAAIMYVFFFMGMFAATYTFPAMVGTIGEYGAFWSYSASCVIIALVVGHVLPDTRGLSLEQIDDLFRYGKKYIMQSMNSRFPPQKIP
ncbi:facilitated trehalose transporter Tret1-2 homolog [Procambarus clarkii]|uniref:facilitated trehalose transporter Tret1-2 homolog n=1 Tax=Procambarus clarkii TaxID=6728 RepID=UPI003743FDDF